VIKALKSNSNKWIYLAVLAVIWGSSFILIKRGLVALAPTQVASLRMLVSWLALVPLVIHRFKEVKKRDYRYILATGLLGNGIPAFLFAFAQTRVNSSLAGMLNTLTPVFVVIVGFFIFKIRFHVSHILGIIAGLTGAVILIYNGTADDIFSGEIRYGLLIVAATICYSFSVTIIRHNLHHIDAVLITGFALFIAGIPCGIYLFTTDFLSRFASHQHTWMSFFSIVILAVMSTSFSTILFNKLIKVTSALYASSVTYLIPVMALVWGLLDGETISWIQLLGLVIILSGIYLINSETVREVKSLQKEQKI